MLRMFVPVLTYPDESSILGLQRALDLAATVGAEVLAAVVEIDIPPLTRPAIPLGIDVMEMSAQAEGLSRVRADDASAWLKRTAERLNLKLTVQRTCLRLEQVGDTLSSEARTHDLTVMVLGTVTEERAVAEALIFGTGGPVILIPGAGEVPISLLTIAVAWDGSRASARALRDAMPLLSMAERVLLLTAEGDKVIERRSVQGAAALLEQRGISHDRLDVLVSSGRSVGDALQEDALRKEAGLLVMGGYGHTRLRDFILGGATKSVLNNLRIPVLLSH
jgi:nucleotide-binding universal stress UspA family protein